MAVKKLNVIKQLEYNETLVLLLIKSDPMLLAAFGSEFPLGIDLTITCSKENRLGMEQQTFIKVLFQDFILTRQDLIEKYQSLAHVHKIPISEIKSEEYVNPVTPTEPINSKPKEEKNADLGEDMSLAKSTPKKVVTAKVKKTEKAVELPRRYGKEKIEADIAKQGGKATPVQNAMLRVNNLKNLWVNLQARGIKTMLTDNKVLSDTDCRDITSAILIMERKLEHILKRK